jgi:hypothetical protein
MNISKTGFSIKLRMTDNKNNFELGMLKKKVASGIDGAKVPDASLRMKRIVSSSYAYHF